MFAPDALLRFTVQGTITTSNLIAPSLTIDGYDAPVPVCGTRDIPIMSGRHRLAAHSRWMRRYGHASLDIDIAPGQVLEVFYAPPHHQFDDRGAMGSSPQVRRGVGALVGVWVAVGMVVLVPIVAVVALA